VRIIAVRLRIIAERVRMIAVRLRIIAVRVRMIAVRLRIIAVRLRIIAVRVRMIAVTSYTQPHLRERRDAQLHLHEQETGLLPRAQQLHSGRVPTAAMSHYDPLQRLHLARCMSHAEL
jgi:hypothetical protein